jgi:hypothetical protein
MIKKIVIENITSKNRTAKVAISSNIMIIIRKEGVTNLKKKVSYAKTVLNMKY